MKIRRRLAWAAAVYLLYALCAGVLPFMRPQPPPEDFGESPFDAFDDRSSCGDRAALVESPAEGFYTRLHILDEAEERIDVSYYAIHMGASSDLFLGGLLDAANRGVQVRILVDGQFGGLTRAHPSYAAALGGHPNIQLKLYNPPTLLRPWTWNGRLHDKYIIIDDRLLLLGGRNIGDKYFDADGYEGQLSLDRDVLVCRGGSDSVLFQVRDYMDGIWESEDVRQPFSKDTRRGLRRRETLEEGYRQFQAENPSLFDHSGDDYQAWTCAADRIAFFHNDAGPGPKTPKAGFALARLLLDAQESVVLQSPYVVLDQGLKELLTALGRREIQTSILTNSPAIAPNPIACAAYLNRRDQIVETGLALWEYGGPDSLHAKSYCIDDRISVVGSYNLDPRSAYLNTELLLAIDSPAFASRLKEAQEHYFDQSVQALGPPELPFFRRVLFSLLSPPARLFTPLI